MRYQLTYLPKQVSLISTEGSHFVLFEKKLLFALSLKNPIVDQGIIKVIIQRFVKKKLIKKNRSFR